MENALIFYQILSTNSLKEVHGDQFEEFVLWILELKGLARSIPIVPKKKKFEGNDKFHLVEYKKIK